MENALTASIVGSPVNKFCMTFRIKFSDIYGTLDSFGAII